MTFTRSFRPAHPGGFTLVELLVALSLLAMLSVLSWRTLDGMTRTEAMTRETSVAWLEWQTVLAQWSTDLDALHDAPTLPRLSFDGLSLRLVRHHPNPPAGTTSALMVVAWARHSATDAPSGSRWARWASPPLMHRDALDTAWSAADLWARAVVRDQQAQAMLLPPIVDWQVFFYRGGAWTNPQSSADAGGTPLPDAIRLVLTLPDQGHVTGQLTRDWIRPVQGGGRPQ